MHTILIEEFFEQGDFLLVVELIATTTSSEHGDDYSPIKPNHKHRFYTL